MLFKKEMAELILDGLKWQTRRWSLRKPAKVDSLHYAQTKLYDKESRFARLKITRVWEWNGVYITPEDAIAEGFQRNPEKSDKELCGRFLNYYNVINAHQPRKTERTHWAIEFEVIEKYLPRAEAICGCGDFFRTYFNEPQCETCQTLDEMLQ